MSTTSARSRPLAVSLRAVVWWVLAPAVLLGVIAMHSMVSAPADHADHAEHVMIVAPADAASSDHAAAPATEDGAAQAACGLLMVCLAVLLAAALTLLAGPVRCPLERARTSSPGEVVPRRPPFRVMPVLLTTSILRC